MEVLGSYNHIEQGVGIANEQINNISSNAEDKNHRGMTYTWKDIDVYSNIVEPNSCLKTIKESVCRRLPETQKHILKNVNGIARPGELTAIMGASGAGKTTLLNVLTCRNRGKLQISGNVEVNGFPIDKNVLSSISAYIQQTDVFIGTLTTREHLQFQATLRMDQKISLKERMKTVEKIIDEMGLSKCADTVIGIPGRLKGLSGGQQKRLSIASELLTDPSILFCDEITTGLDSFMAQSIVKSLKLLASRGKTIICTIHQPASEVYDLFDRVLLMSEGRTAFLGDCEDALSFFSKAGFPAPENYNPADHFIFTLAIRPGNEEACIARSTKICDEYDRSEFSRNVFTAISNKENRTVELLQSLSNSSRSSLYKASWMTQFRACLWRSWKTVLNDPLVVKVRTLQMIFLAVVIGLMYFDQELDQKGIQNISGFIFIVIANLTFSSVFPVANVFWDELPVFIRDHYNRMYRTDVYYFAKTMSELPIYLLLPAVYYSIGYWMVGLNSQPERFFIGLGIAILIANVGSSLGYMVSTISSSLEMTIGLAPVFMMPLLFFGGSLLNKDSIPVYFVWLKYLSWFLHGNEALSINQWKGVDEIECPAGNDTLCIPNGDLVLQRLSFEEDNFFLSVGILFALLVGLRAVSLFGLVMKTKNSD